MNNTSVDSYLRDGCGRCPDFQTPQCKVHAWADVLRALRGLMAGSGLDETMKWGSPCYVVEDRNVVMIAAFRDSCALSFFRGAEIDDDTGLLVPAGPNSHVARLIRFRTVDDVTRNERGISDLVARAAALERAGARARRASAEELVPAELARRLAEDPTLAVAFAALTPGRRRSHVLHIAGAAQAATRERRVERCAADIVAGRGFNER
jgi:uncharacterized protein YdeI (YjbR/CyaY-like superfamily)